MAERELGRGGSKDAGVHVIYGVAGTEDPRQGPCWSFAGKTQRIQRYVHLATGNYNDRTARMYSDIGLLTVRSGNRGRRGGVLQSSDRLFRSGPAGPSWPLAPIGLRQKFIDLIEREIQASTPDRPGLIMAQDQLAGRRRDLPRALSGQPGGRQNPAERPRHLLSAARLARRVRTQSKSARSSIVFCRARPGCSISATADMRKSI